MARILHDGEWYDQISTEALYEEEYERLLLANSDLLFPSYKLIDFKRTVESENGAAKADFALIDRRYKDWWIVEAELKHHSFDGHVRPQVEILSQAFYGDEVARYLVEKDQALDLGRMFSMLRGQQPRVMVIVNFPAPVWAQDLRRYNAIVAILEVFRSRRNSHLYRLNGEYPLESSSVSSMCRVELARFLRVLSPGILPIQHNETMSIYFKDGITDWSRLDIRDRVYLYTSKPISLNQKATYELVEYENSKFKLFEKQ